MANKNPQDENAFCINCGVEITEDANFCTECGSSQDPSELNTSQSQELPDHSGFTSWAVGFKPGRSARNVVVGILYLIFLQIGIILLSYAYLVENPKYTKYAQYFAAVTIGFIGLVTVFGGGVPSVFLGLVILVAGSLFAPAVRERVGLDNVPGISSENSNKRNVITGYLYFFAVEIVSIILIGATAPA